jgi:hypothetical protein
MRVQIPAYADQWMQGDKYGEVTRRIRADRARGELHDTWEVRLDKSGKHRRYIADECTVVEE